MIARWIGTALLLVGLACSPLLFATPAQAGDSGVQVSMNPDGPFQDQLSRQLFAGAGKLVPTDRVTRRFYVRNDSDVVARTSLKVTQSGPRKAFADAIDVDVDLGDVTSSGPRSGDPDCTPTVTGVDLAPGAVQAVDVTVVFRDVTGTRAASQRASLDLLVQLTQVGETGVVEDCGEQTAPDSVGGDDPCAQGAVVTVAGSQSCVPTAVDAGDGREAQSSVQDRVARSAFPALLVLAVGGGLLIGAWPLARRRSSED